MNDDDLLPIRYLNDLLFCERRAALHLVEGIWCDNQYTTEGLLAHKRVDLPKNVIRKDQRHVTGMWLVSHRLGLIGKGDLIEFVPDESDTPIPYPVDFKRGKRRRWDNNEAQLCAQAMCLEEMLDVAVPRGAIFHIKSQRREEVTFNLELRTKTANAAARLHELLRRRETPKAKYHRKCEGCSLLQWCMPKSLRPRATAANYLNRLLHDSLPESNDSDQL
ncbi:MAG: CRISPR-associated protein Cas4 [Planctomycetales bacterium]|nr:CRISPR-associated protein Cas4 [Planctomycetales bacterium]